LRNVGVWVPTGGGYGSRSVPTLYTEKKKKRRDPELLPWRFEVRSALSCEKALTLPYADLPLEEI
jgi:hypothetical protein